MPYKIDYLDRDVLAWSLTEDGVTCARVSDFTPSLYLSAPSSDDLLEIQGFVDRFTEVVHTDIEAWRTGWRHEPEPVLRIDVDDIEAVPAVASDLRRWDQPGTYKPYNVDLSREFRYCLETGSSPTPARDPTLLRIDVSEPELVRDDGIQTLYIDGDQVENDPPKVARIVAERIASTDPDVLVVSDADIIPALFEAAPATQTGTNSGDGRGTNSLPDGRRTKATGRSATPPRATTSPAGRSSTN